jgi:hypothetical protein
MAVLKGLLYFGLFTTIILAERDCTDFPPDHVQLECVIVPRGGRCHKDSAGERQINACSDRAACVAWTGIDLIVSCEDSEDGTSLRLYHEGSTQGLPNATWTFAEASTAEGLYECRHSNGSLFANRSVVFDEGVYVIPGRSSSYEQSCRHDIVPDYSEDYDCNVPRKGSKRYFAGGPHTLYFNILGTRPIAIEVAVLWVNHYPVDLHLSYDSEASGSGTLHNVTLNSMDIVHIGGVKKVTKAEAYLAITAVHNGNQSSTMCVSHQFFGGSKLFPNETLPRDITVVEGEIAEFACEAGTGYEASDVESATISFLVQPPQSPDFTECLNYRVSATELSPCTKMERCSNMQFSNSSLGESAPFTHTLTARWSKVKVEFDGYRVACALAVNGVTQWKKSATLTVELHLHPLPHLASLLWSDSVEEISYTHSRVAPPPTTTPRITPME